MSMIELVIALPCEARPIIEHFDLDGFHPEGPFRQYRNETIRLIISGPGIRNAAAATGYIGNTQEEQPIRSFWLNIGTAGHGSREIGSAVRAGKVVDNRTGDTWYPQPVFSSDFPLETVCTVASPETQLSGGSAYDMEAAGFYPTALRFATAEFVHCCKIISDQGETDLASLSEERITELVEGQLDEISRFIEHGFDLVASQDNMKQRKKRVKQFLDTWSFSAAQKDQLERLVERWNAVFPETELTPSSFKSGHSAAEVLAEISSELEHASVPFDS